MNDCDGYDDDDDNTDDNEDNDNGDDDQETISEVQGLKARTSSLIIALTLLIASNLYKTALACKAVLSAHSDVKPAMSLK